ncbi:metallohydrolase [Mesorhizobium tamadayense]|uniref:metallohydrolase n=1 Tax=Mesorhizobium tamadayense TaxID=425306 RepID=UPI001FDF79D1|nr:metallohydrolase [Mesorhizobium tamadayense]
MTASSTHFKVDNGDMHFLATASEKTILIDCNIRSDADDPDGDVPDVAQQLRSRLKRDPAGYLYVDAFLLTHPDQDHCRGLWKHFHLGPVSEWSAKADKIVIREMWSSPIVFRRASKKQHTLCDDANAWATEARRRVKRFRDFGCLSDGDRILILGEDINGKTDGLGAILVRTDSVFQSICGSYQIDFRARLIAPIPPQDDEQEEEELSKNDSSVVVNIELGTFTLSGASHYLFGGDAEVGIWERLWQRNKDAPENLQYDLLAAPHHCSWHSLSWDSWSDWKELAEVSPDARKALGQALSGAYVISSSKPIKDDDVDPPCIRAKREYKAILSDVNGTFECLGDLKGDEPLEFEVTGDGLKIKTRTTALAAPSIIGGLAGAAAGSSSAYGAQPFKHG